MRAALGGLLVVALSGLLAFTVSQAADTAASNTWRAVVEQRLDRIEDKLDRLIERRR